MAQVDCELVDKFFESVEIESTKLKNLRSQKKLCLILDLDHTLIHSKYVGNLDVNARYLVQLRPFVHEFLKEANKLFQMYIYTLAQRHYAMGVVSLLDPDGVYFGSRIIASEDSTNEYKKSLDVLPDVDESSVLILDDLDYVWSKHLRNLMVILPYHYFNPPKWVFSDEKEGSGALNVALKVLKEVHALYFNRDNLSVDCDVRDLLEVVMENLSRIGSETEPLMLTNGGIRKIKLFRDTTFLIRKQKRLRICKSTKKIDKVRAQFFEKEH